MVRRVAIRRTLLGATAAAAMLGAPALAAPATQPSRNKFAASVVNSRRLWATFDVCNPSDQPDTVGVRGSMPGDGRKGDEMFMGFRLQFLRPPRHWANLPGGATPDLMPIGDASVSRQWGTSFVIRPVPGKPAFVLRAVATFQWQRGSQVLARTELLTGTGHRSLAGADPPNFSAATCSLG
jgi:hypothetical protein